MLKSFLEFIFWILIACGVLVLVCAVTYAIARMNAIAWHKTRQEFEDDLYDPTLEENYRGEKQNTQD